MAGVQGNKPGMSHQGIFCRCAQGSVRDLDAGCLWQPSELEDKLRFFCLGAVTRRIKECIMDVD